MNDPSQKSNRPNCKATRNVTSSPASADGRSHYSLPDGRKTNRCGRDHAHASHSVLPDDKKVKTTIDTYGLSGNASSASAALQQSLENRLRQQLPTGGLTMFIKGWKRKATPLGRLYCQLAVSARPIDVKDYGLWPTPKARDHHANGQGQFSDSLPQKLNRLWPTPNATKTTKNSKDPQMMKEGGRQTTLADATWIASKATMWPTPVSTDSTKRGNISPRSGAMGLTETVALWTTPSSRDWKDSQGMTAQRADGKSRNDQLPRQVFGMQGSGSLAQTANKGSLNPAFVCWLMGFPPAVLSSMVSAMQSFRKPRRNLYTHPVDPLS